MADATRPEADPIAEHIKRVVDAAPPLSQAQQDRLRLILAPVIKRLSDRRKAAADELPPAASAA